MCDLTGVIESTRCLSIMQQMGGLNSIRSNLFEWLAWKKFPSHRNSSAVRANRLCTCIYSSGVWQLRPAGRRVSQQNAALFTNGRNDGPRCSI